MNLSVNSIDLRRPIERMKETFRVGIEVGHICDLNQSAFSATFCREVLGFKTHFNLSLRNYISMGKKLDRTFILELDYRKSDEAYAASHWTFGRYTHLDFGAAAHDIAVQFCKENNLVLNDQRNHWPTLYYIVSVPEEKKETSQTFEQISRIKEENRRQSYGR